VQERTVRLQ